jgi:Uncharacterized conserved protein
MFYVPYSDLSDEARKLDFAIASVMEEFEAVNYYNQRADVATDESLKEIMIHNRDEEIEHIAMLLEWFRRNVPKFQEELSTYLFTDLPIIEVEEAATDGAEGGDDAGGKKTGGPTLRLGSLRK